MSVNPEVVKVLQSISTQRLARAPMSFTLGMLPHAALTFSMAGEDMALRKLLKRHVVAGKGTYVDIGCGAPDSISNTCLFYCMGWRGLCVDANREATPYWQATRPEDTFVHAAIGEHPGETFFFRHKTNMGMHTIRDAATAPGADFVPTPEVVPLRRLDQLFAEHLMGRTIQLMSMDIEGAEMGALRSNDWARWRPEVLIMECVDFSFEAPTAAPTVAFLLAQGYRLDSKIGENVILIDGRG